MNSLCRAGGKKRISSCLWKTQLIIPN